MSADEKDGLTAMLGTVGMLCQHFVTHINKKWKLKVEDVFEHLQ